MKLTAFAALLLVLCLCLAPVSALGEAGSMDPILDQLTLGMSYDDALALNARLEPAESAREGQRTLWTEAESWGVLGEIMLYFGANDALINCTWFCQIAEPACTLLDERFHSDTAQADSEAVYKALCADMTALAGVEANEITPLSYSSDGGQYQMMRWTGESPERACVWAANPLHYYYCRFTVKLP